jgi:ABC-type transporter Mla MlaB component
MGITLQIGKRDKWETLTYVGPINEDAEVHLAPMIKSLSPNVIINLRNVEYVNSCGVRAWINFIREAEKGRKLVFEECTPEIVSQINMIPNFRGSASIQSVYAAYMCNSCDEQRWVLFEKGRNLPTSATGSIDAPKCEGCGNMMEMEELEDEFFAWVDTAA